jgi:hypothetical protein
MGTWLVDTSDRLGACLNDTKRLDKTQTTNLSLSFFFFMAQSCVPDDVLALILRQLGLVDFCAAAGTCRVWHAAARKRAAWPKSKMLVFDKQLPYARDAPPLSQTAWAGCTKVAYRGSYGFEQLNRRWLGKISDELVYVSDLSVLISNIQCSEVDIYLGDLCRPLLKRLTRLHTNQVALVQATSRENLVSLTIEGNVPFRDEPIWTHVLVTLSSLTHVRIDLYGGVVWLGKALAQLANDYHVLRSIVLPPTEESAKQCLLGLFDYELDLSSIRTLTNLPAQLGTLYSVLKRMPHLVEYTCVPFGESERYNSSLPSLLSSENNNNNNDKSDGGSQLASTSCEAHDFLFHPWLISSFCNLTDLTLYDFGHCQYDWLEQVMRSYVRLVRLCLPGRSLVWKMKQIGGLAPHLEQLSLCETMMWERRHRLSACFTHLSTLAHFQHLELMRDKCIDWGFPATATETTSALLQGMLRSPRWRQITCSRMPVPIRVRSDTFASKQLELVRWNVVSSGRTQTIVSYCPRLVASRWRTWVPGLRSHRVIWTRI